MQKVNYQKWLDETIEGLGGRTPSLLLHACCAPCSSYVLEYLSRFFNITLYYYNPNISPQQEYEKRVEEVQRLLAELPTQNPVRFAAGNYDPQRFFELVKGHEADPERGKRCTICYRMRLEEAAKYAKENGFEWFTTTLSLSPYKDAERLNAIGAELEKKYGVKYLHSDFKKRGGYKRSIELSRQYNLYRQNYCGCVFSKRQSG
ncbi:epoxyqueuosine reductase QueH [Thermocaproicibacter melissae]|uniref:epoxyqueuosine reductase QueH n=1 Tax=Thermocaproicibacter melissae TaxID=2966552 RepID=UPI0024B0E213|nr:epoxyqueuosine reductase QueH [Thermocaproicibacter melissae]WBY64372.1 epoxyqueuosine reductase QueH [Thermocaproicibacter melissae]